MESSSDSIRQLVSRSASYLNNILSLSQSAESENSTEEVVRPHYISQNDRSLSFNETNSKSLYLCDNCKDLETQMDDLLQTPDLFSPHLGGLIGRYQFPGMIERRSDMEISVCDLCKVLAALQTETPPHTESQRFQLVAYCNYLATNPKGPARRALLGKNSPWITSMWLSGFGWQDQLQTVFGIVPEHSPKATGYVDREFRHIERSGIIVPEILEAGRASSRKMWRAGPSASMDHIRSWLEDCRKCHSHSVVPQTDPLNRIRNFRVIQVSDQPPRVIQAPRQCQYGALSYVWGTSSDEADQIGPPLSRLPSRLPRVVDDAIKVCRALQIPFLWVDRFCIDQGDDEEKHSQIQNMHEVYRGAELTIIAAAGDGPRHGLAGIGRHRPISQYRVEVGGVSFVSNPGDPRKAVELSRWMTRAWTYQEAVFSPRRLFFTEQQTYFECSSSSYSETFGSTPIGILQHDNADSTVLFAQEQINILQHIEEYTRRTLSFESDVLNGMLGIFSEAQQAKHPWHHIWGNPFSDHLPPNSLAGSLNIVVSLQSFVRGLTFMTSPTSKRRTQFPSWSWTGWQGPVTWPLDKEDPRFERCKVTDIKVSVVTKDGITTPLYKSGIFNDARYASQLCHFLQLEANIVKARFYHIPDSTSEEGSQERELFYTPWNKVSKTTMEFRKVYLSPEFLLGEFGSQTPRLIELDCIILSDQWSRFLDVTSMVITWNGHYAERVGIISNPGVMQDKWFRWDVFEGLENQPSIAFRNLPQVRKAVRLR